MSLNLKRDSHRPVSSSKRKRMRFIVDIGSPLFYFSGVVFLLLLQPSVAAGGKILVHPESQRVALNSGNIMFSCQTEGIDARWRINENYYNAENHTEDEIEFVEFVTIHDFDDAMNIQNIYMWIPSSSRRNMTQISCLSRIDQEVSSDSAELIIMGGPAAPEPSLRTISSSRLVLEWNRPFTWDDHPIEHYLLTSSSDRYYSPELKIENVTMARESVEIDRKDEVGECEVIEFSVRANNGLADSQPGSVTGGFPIAPDTSIATIVESLRFSQDLVPIISLEIQLPRVCPYQDIQYKVTLTRMDFESDILSITPERLQYGEGHTVTAMFNENLASGATYTATATFWTFAESDESISAPVEVSTTIHTTIATPPTGSVSVSLTSEYIIIIGAGGGAIILILLVLIIIALVVCLNARKRSRYQSPRSDIQQRPLPMVTNPIYEGSPVYETVGQQLNSLERPRTPTTPTSIAPLLTESPYTVSAVDPSYTQSVQPFPTEGDNYQVMISPLRNKVPPRHESNLDQDVRYVPEPGSAIITRSDW